jgi:murein DD-endopeptidase
MIQTTIRKLALALLLPALAACAGAPTADRRADSSPRLAAAEHALAMVGKPYRYGGYTPAGFDCSGLVHYSFRRAGLDLPRDTRSLRDEGTGIDRRTLSRGDLVFFDQEGKKSSHVGIYLGGGEFVHAPSTGGRVRVDRIDARYWQQHFSTARRI